MSGADLAGRSFLVTGANSGIGRATAEALAARGGRVILASRSRERTQPVLDAIRARHPPGDVEFIELDLASLASVRRAADTVMASGRGLDVLVNNAGMAVGRGLTREGFEVTIGTNYLGPFYLTELLLPLLRESPQGRIVNVASVAHTRVRTMDWSLLERRAKGAWSGVPMYAVSKLMNILHARDLARRLADTRVTTYALHPGGVASNIWRKVPWPVRPVMMLTMISNEEGARTPVYCATAPELASISGRYYYDCREARGSTLSRDEALAAELYERSHQAIDAALGAA